MDNSNEIDEYIEKNKSNICGNFCNLKINYISNLAVNKLVGGGIIITLIYQIFSIVKKYI